MFSHLQESSDENLSAKHSAVALAGAGKESRCGDQNENATEIIALNVNTASNPVISINTSPRKTAKDEATK